MGAKDAILRNGQRRKKKGRKREIITERDGK